MLWGFIVVCLLVLLIVCVVMKLAWLLWVIVIWFGFRFVFDLMFGLLASDLVGLSLGADWFWGGYVSFDFVVVLFGLFLLLALDLGYVVCNCFALVWVIWVDDEVFCGWFVMLVRGWCVL